MFINSTLQVTSRQFFEDDFSSFPPLVDTNKYLYLEPQWPPFLKDNPSFKQGPNSNQNKGHQRVPGLYHSQWAFRFAPVGLTGSAVKVNKVTLIPRGQAKGLTWFTPGEDQSLISAAMLKAPVTLQKVSPKESGDSGRMSTLEICTRILKTMAWKGQLLFPLWQVFSNFTGSQVEFQVSHNEKSFVFPKNSWNQHLKVLPVEIQRLKFGVCSISIQSIHFRSDVDNFLRVAGQIPLVGFIGLEIEGISSPFRPSLFLGRFQTLPLSS